MIGDEVIVCNHLQALTASQATREPPVKRVSPVGDDVSLCRQLQALAASRATREPPVRRVSQVGRISYLHMKQVLALCLGGVMDTVNG